MDEVGGYRLLSNFSRARAQQTPGTKPQIVYINRRDLVQGCAHTHLLGVYAEESIQLHQRIMAAQAYGRSSRGWQKKIRIEMVPKDLK
jgi:hypothetical protein